MNLTFMEKTLHEASRQELWQALLVKEAEQLLVDQQAGGLADECDPQSVEQALDRLREYWRDGDGPDELLAADDAVEEAFFILFGG
jgi:hypothetical protein